MTTPEGAVKDKIKAYLTEIGAYHFWPVQTGYGSTTVDCLACINGRFFGIEVKRPGTVDATPRQNHTIRLIAEAKGIAFVTDSFERAKKFIDDFGLGLYDPENNLRLFGRYKAIVDILKSFPEGIDGERLRDILYRNDMNPPQNKTLNTQICFLQRKLRKYGFAIEVKGHGGGRKDHGTPGHYRLIHVDRQSA